MQDCGERERTSKSKAEPDREENGIFPALKTKNNSGNITVMVDIY